MQLKILIFALYFISLNVLGIFSIMIKTNLKSQSKMNLRDRNICMRCLDYIDKLTKSKNSSACENNQMQSQLMCYEIYYYFYYFKPNFFFANLEGIYKNKKCDICSKLDKCEFYECVGNFESDEEDYKIKNLLFKESNKRSLESLPPVKNIKEKTEFKQITNEINDLLNSQNFDYVKQKTFENEMKKLKFTAVNSGSSKSYYTNKNNINLHKYYSLKKLNLNQETNSQQEDLTNSSDLVTEHMDLLKLKIQHVLDELFNLGNIHNIAQDIKKHFINLVIYHKLKAEKKLESNKNSTIVRIKNKTKMTNYLENIQKLSQNFIKLYDQYENLIEQKANPILEKNSNDVDSKNVDSSIVYLTSLIQSYNEMFRLGQVISESNIKLFDSILNDFSIANFFGNDKKQVEGKKVYKLSNQNKIENNNYQEVMKKEQTKVENNLENHLIPQSIPDSEFKILMNKIEKLEKDQEKFQHLIMQSHRNERELNVENILKNYIEHNATIDEIPVLKIDFKQSNSSIGLPSRREYGQTKIISNTTNIKSHNSLLKENILEKYTVNKNPGHLVDSSGKNLSNIQKEVEFNKLINHSQIPYLNNKLFKKIDNKFYDKKYSDNPELVNSQYANSITNFNANIPPAYLSNINSHTMINPHKILKNSESKEDLTQSINIQKDTFSDEKVNESTNHYDKKNKSVNNNYGQTIKDNQNNSIVDKISFEKSIKANSNAKKHRRLKLIFEPSITQNYENEIRSTDIIEPNKENLKTVNSFFEYDQEKKKKKKKIRNKKKKPIKYLNKFISDRSKNLD
jgi:hypothetical protein